jgi:Flp pilus assembly protein TadD
MFPQAVELLRSATVLKPASKQSSFFLAKTYQRMGRKREAASEFDRGRKLAGDETTGLANATAAKGLGVDAR